MAYPVFSGTRTSVAVGGIDAALLAASSGDVLVLAPGTHTATEDVPAGVTVRGQFSAGTTFRSIGVTVGDLATFRDLTILPYSDDAALLTPDSCWFENVIFAVEEGTATGSISYTGPGTGDTITFNACTFYLNADYGRFSFDTNGAADFYSCLVIGCDDQVNLISWYASVDAGLRFFNCTFASEGTDNFIGVDLGGGTLGFYNNILYAPNASVSVMDNMGDASGGVVGSRNYYQINDTTPIEDPDLFTVWAQIKDLGIHPESYALRNSSYARNRAITAYTTADRNYMWWGPDTATGFTCGCFAWQPEASALYRPWFLDPVDGFNFLYNDGELNSTDGLTSGVTQVNSQQEALALIRSLVQDITHPSLGDVYVDIDGVPHVQVNGPDSFDMEISGPSAKIFGSFSGSALYSSDE